MEKGWVIGGIMKGMVDTTKQQHLKTDLLTICADRNVSTSVD